MILDELRSKGLAKKDPDEMYGFNTRHYRGTTELGNQLVQFIKSPIDERDEEIKGKT